MSVLEIFNKVRSEGRKALTEVESKKVLSIYGIPVTKLGVAKSVDKAVSLAREIGFPVAMKILSPDILHKSDVGGVMLNIGCEEEVEKAYKKIIENVLKHKPDARIEGVVVQEMAPMGREIIIGAIRDVSFGPVLMFGLGGIFVEVLNDVSFKLIPITVEEAYEMIDEIKSAPLLKGYRGAPPADIKALVDTLLKVSNMVSELEEHISEMDLNPIFLYEEGKGLKVVDARIILS